MARPAKSQPNFNHITDAAPEYVDDILWHRVALAVAALALVVAALGYGVFRLIGADEETTPVTSLALEELTQQAPPAAIPQRSTAQAMTDEEAETQADIEPVAPAANTNSDMAASTAPAVQPVPAESTPIESTPAAPATTASAPIKTTPAEPALKPAAPDIASTQPARASTASSPDTRYQVRTTILVPAVKRALITKSMRGLEPGTPLTDTRSLNDQSRFSLYQYVDIRGQAGQTLIYHWKRNGKTVAKVRIPVGSDKWRNHSSKNFNQNLMGDWQVDVTNQNNMLLVRSEFHLGQ